MVSQCAPGLMGRGFVVLYMGWDASMRLRFHLGSLAVFHTLQGLRLLPFKLAGHQPLKSVSGCIYL